MPCENIANTPIRSCKMIGVFVIQQNGPRFFQVSSFPLTIQSQRHMLPKRGPCLARHTSTSAGGSPAADSPPTTPQIAHSRIFATGGVSIRVTNADKKKYFLGAASLYALWEVGPANIVHFLHECSSRNLEIVALFFCVS